MTKLQETTIARRDRKLCPTVDCGEGLTEQSHKDQCNINLILKDYARTGFLKHAKENQGRYDDVSSMDFEKAQIIVAETKSLFDGLPAQVRKEFGHDVGSFLDYVQNPDNVKALESRGILIGNDGLTFTGQVSLAPTSSTAAADQVAKAGEQTSDSASGEAPQGASE